MIYACSRPGFQVVDRLSRCGSVKLTTQVRPSHDAENLSVHQMRSRLFRVAFKAFSHGLGIGSGDDNLCHARSVNDEHHAARQEPLEHL